MKLLDAPAVPRQLNEAIQRAGGQSQWARHRPRRRACRLRGFYRATSQSGNVGTTKNSKESGVKTFASLRSGSLEGEGSG
jgi:hypothetical protein